MFKEKIQNFVNKDNKKELSQAEIRKKMMEDLHYLPRYQDVLVAFDDMNDIRLWMDLFDPPDKGKKRRNNYQHFEVWNEEYLNKLSDYLTERIKNSKGNKNEPITILEVGAGNGQLSYFLNKKLKRLS